ncbi:MAG: carbon-nitrogen hydrolase family protein [Bacteroidetes bacterium]|jgi:N-carbamoylputrescine amidase|nr:carbon-nitrogen hydrolase family protein [Bacteroidota bacterium]
MHLALVQQHATSALDDNLQRGLEALAEAAAAGADCVVYPELAFTPFYPQHRAGPDALDLAEPIPGPTTEAFQAAAAEHGVVVVLNLYERAGDRAFDTSPVIDVDGTLLGRTRMMHITDYEGFYEQGYYAPGDTGAPVYETAVGRLGVAICYDRHYPEYLRALALQEAELVVVPQAGAKGEWPEGLFEAELRVGAFQNGVFMALANRVGDEDVLTFDGGSFVADPHGQLVAQAPRGTDAILHAEIDLSACERSHARQLFLQHRRPDQYARGAVTSPAERPLDR